MPPPNKVKQAIKQQQNQKLCLQLLNDICALSGQSSIISEELNRQLTALHHNIWLKTTQLSPQEEALARLSLSFTTKDGKSQEGARECHLKIKSALG